MPRQKDLKRLVRSRMRKTGESYTTARLRITRKKSHAEPDSTGAREVALPESHESLAGMSDAAVQARTGRAWGEWVRTLDRWGALEKTHLETATHLHERYQLGGWWAQMVTVGYERIRGLRARGQRRDGKWEATKSRTFHVPIEALFEAWSSPRTRARWLSEKLTIRKATPNRSMRISWPDGTRVELTFQSKGGRSQVAVQHGKLASRADAEERRQFWAERLDALHELLTR